MGSCGSIKGCNLYTCDTRARVLYFLPFNIVVQHLTLHILQQCTRYCVPRSLVVTHRVLAVVVILFLAGMLASVIRHSGGLNDCTFVIVALFTMLLAAA